MGGASQDLSEITSAKGRFAETLNTVFLSMTVMDGADLSRSRMLGASLNGARLHGANLSNVNLPETNLAQAHLYAADLSESELGDADLSGTSLTAVNLTGVGLRDANLSGTDLSGFFSEGSTTRHPPEGLTQAQLDEACADPDNPPQLDPDSGLVWNPKPCSE